MRREPVTEESLAEARAVAREEPVTGLPELARFLLGFGWQIDRAELSERIPYFEEAAEIYRGLLASGSDEHLEEAAHAISSLGLQYSLAHADDRSLAAKSEAAALARRLNRHRGNAEKEIEILSRFAHGLAEAGQFANAVTAQREIVDIYRGIDGPAFYGWRTSFTWSLLDLAIYLDLAGQTAASLDIEREALTLKRRIGEGGLFDRAGLVIWLAGISHRFTETGHPQEARELLDEAIAACDRLPAERELWNFGFDHGVQAALFARSGARDERAGVSGAIPIGVSPDPQALQPVLGVSFHWWAFSVRHAYLAGLQAINDAISTAGDPFAIDPAELAEFATLVRRRNIRQSVAVHDHPQQFIDNVIPALAESVALERQLAAARPSDGPERLIRALTDQAIGQMVTGSNSLAGDTLREARDLYRAAESPAN